MELMGSYWQAHFPKTVKMVVGWLAFHEDEAYKAWNLEVRGEHFDKIAPM